jgi:Lipocalin-like domain
VNAKSWILSVAVVAASVAIASAQTLKEQLTGTWTLVSNVQKYQDGKEENSFGPKMKGQLMLSPSGRFSMFLLDGERPKSADPIMPIGPAVANFGTYSVDEGGKTLTYHVEGAASPNFEGTEQKATVTIKGDELSYVLSPIPSSRGPFVPAVTWKRAK